MSRLIFYDTETTGIRAENDYIIEIAAFDPERNTTFERLINPGVPIPSEASAIHHITDDMVQDSPSFSEIIDDFETFCEGDVILVAHNNDGFDIHFLRQEFLRSERTLPGHWKFLDTLKWSRKYRSDLPKHALQYLREVYGFEANNAHRALDDVIVLHQVYMSMVDNLSPDQAYELMQGPTALPEKMPFGKHQGVPLADVPKNYLKWLASSGALAKPQNDDLRKALEKLDLLEQAST